MKIPLPMVDRRRPSPAEGATARLNGDRRTPRLKPSRYNLLFDDGGDAWLYNTRRGGFLRVGGTPAAKLAWLAEPDRVTIPEGTEAGAVEAGQVDPSLLPALLEGDFLVPEDVDELAVLQAANRAARYGSKSLNLTILTTLGCNLDCFYCYEDKHDGVMPGAVADRIVEFVSRQAEGLTSMGVTWFGGEPLIGIRAIERLSEAFLSLSAKHGVSYGADIITNGYLLTRSTAEDLAAWGVGSAQITLDGVREVHDSRRYKVRGGPSFDVIFQNILDCWDVIGIAIRMNLDRSNVDGAPALIDYLAEHDLQGKVHLSFAPVHAEGKGCRDRGDSANGDLFGLEEIAALQIELNEYALEKGFPFEAIPTSRAHACCADKSLSFVIEPDGTLQKCWQTVSDPGESIGNVFTGAVVGPNLLKWLNYDPFKEGFKCRSCKVLPICMGWCPQKVMADPSPESCNYIKHTITKDLKLYYRTQATMTDGVGSPSLAGCSRP